MFVVCIMSFLSLLAFLHLKCKHRLVFLLGIAACRPSDGASGPAAGPSAGNHPSPMFRSFNPGTSPGGGAATGTSPCHPLQPAWGSLFSHTLSHMLLHWSIWWIRPEGLCMAGTSISLSQAWAWPHTMTPHILGSFFPHRVFILPPEPETEVHFFCLLH